MFNPYAAGDKVYGTGRSWATRGPVDKLGYRERDAAQKARNRSKNRLKNKQRNAALRRMKANQDKRYMSSDWLGSR